MLVEDSEELLRTFSLGVGKLRKTRENSVEIDYAGRVSRMLKKLRKKGFNEQ